MNFQADVHAIKASFASQRDYHPLSSKVQNPTEDQNGGWGCHFDVPGIPGPAILHPQHWPFLLVTHFHPSCIF